MTAVLDIVIAVHMLFAALWTGGTLLISGSVIPAARRELLGLEALGLITNRFSYLTIGSVLLLLFSGGHMAGTLYTAETLFSTDRGMLVMTMVGLWLLLTIVLSIGLLRLRTTPPEPTKESQTKTETAVAARIATKARPWFLTGSVVSIGLLVVAGQL